MINWFQQNPTFFKVPQAIQAHRIKPFEDVIARTMARDMPMLFEEALDILEPCNDPFFSCITRVRFRSLCLDAKLGKDVFV